MTAAARREAAGGRVDEEPREARREARAGTLDRARLGDREAFAELYAVFAADVERLCRRLLGPGPEAEDARSEVFLRAQAGFARYDARRPFRTWLLAVASHHCIDRLRRRHREERLFAPAPADGELAADAPGPLGAALAAEARRELLRAVERLAPRHRAPLVMRYFADLSYADIAEALGTHEGQVATLLFRARQRLREALGGRP